MQHNSWQHNHTPEERDQCPHASRKEAFLWEVSKHLTDVIGILFKEGVTTQYGACVWVTVEAKDTVSSAPAHVEIVVAHKETIVPSSFLNQAPQVGIIPEVFLVLGIAYQARIFLLRTWPLPGELTHTGDVASQMTTSKAAARCVTIKSSNCGKTFARL